ncbi:MAG: TrkH family potassium uptake protein [Planctomycetes bacterium]|nr:TrkH family potassium uptake protein [Planctomycetota bacterium]
MNIPLLSRLLGTIAMLIGGSMLFSLPWALEGQWAHERDGVVGLAASIAVCFAVGALLRRAGRHAKGQLFRKEAMAIVGLSWILATLLGALPFVFSGTHTGEGHRMDFVDAMFEAQSGFSTTGATVLTELEDPTLVPRTILFWRSSTHFLGGLGIIVLFVVILGQGSAGKAMMRAEMPGPSHSSPQARMQHTAWVLFLIYVGLNALLTVSLLLEGLTLFDALCHAFGTMATGGFSTYNQSVGHFAANPAYNGPLIEMTIVVFMVLAGTNFMLLYFLALFQPKRLLKDPEWRVYAAVIVAATAAIVVAGMIHEDFPDIGQAVRDGLFQTVSIMTTTGFCTADFNRWSYFARALLLVLMFVGGCAGSTGGGMKVIRHILFVKILRLEIEHAFHPSVVRPLRLGGEPVEDQQLRRSILVYFGLIVALFMASWTLTVAWEPDSTWTAHGHDPEQKLLDSATAVTATLNNIGPGLGVVGATENYAKFSPQSKVLFIFLMMIGRLEIFVILVLAVPAFWRSQ